MREISTRTVRRQLLRACLVAPIVLTGCAELPQAPGESIDGLLREGQRLFEAGKHDEALALFQKAATIDPKNWQPYFWMARSWLAKGNWSNAIANARKAFEIAPQGPNVVGVLAEALLGGGREALGARRYKDAIGYLFDYIKIQPSNARAYVDVGRALLGDKRFADALAMLLKGLGLGSAADRPDLLRELLNGGLQALSEGQFRDAIGFLTEYLKLDPARIRAYIDLARAYLQTGQFGDALSTYLRGLGQASGAERQEIVRGLLDGGRQALSSGRAREAVGFLREYLGNDRGNLQAWVDLGKAYWQSNERLNALDAFRRALEIDPRNAEALNFLRGGR